MKIIIAIKRYSEWNELMKYSTLYFMLGTAVYVIITPFMTKLTAAEISAAGIATYAVVRSVDALVLPYVEWITLKDSFSLARYIAAINIALIGLYLIFPEFNAKLFIYAGWFIGIVASVLWGIMGIKYDAMLGSRKDIDFSEVQVTERLVFTLVEGGVGIIAIGIYIMDAITAPLVLVALINLCEILVLNKILKTFD